MKGVRTELIGASEHRWVVKVVRAVEAYLEQHFSDPIGESSIVFHAHFQELYSESLPRVHVLPADGKSRCFYMEFNTTSWALVEDAVPKATSQLLGGLIALSEKLGLAGDALAKRAAELSMTPAKVVVDPEDTGEPPAGRLEALRERIAEPCLRDCVEPWGTLGNDSTADAFEGYCEWRAENPQGDRDAYGRDLVAAWCGSSDLDPRPLPGPDPILSVRNDAWIALAVAQGAVDGQISAVAHRRAMEAIAVELTEAAMSSRGVADPPGRRKALEAVREALLRASVGG